MMNTTQGHAVQADQEIIHAKFPRLGRDYFHPAAVFELEHEETTGDRVSKGTLISFDRRTFMVVLAGELRRGGQIQMISPELTSPAELAAAGKVTVATFALPEPIDLSARKGSVTLVIKYGVCSCLGSRWCQLHGKCICTYDEVTGHLVGEHDSNCPLHG